ncbi:MAG TPA: hypothetical protein VF491_24150, partial [Vicinamibacterales bacterium]
MTSVLRHFIVLIAVAILGSCASSQTPSPVPQPAPAAASVRTAGATSQRQQWLDMFARGYFPGRSGQVFVVPKEKWFVTSHDPLYNFMHGSPWEYDTHIPILLYGPPFVKPGQFSMAAKQQDVAPTVGAIIGATPIPTYTGRVLTEAMAAGAARPRVVTVFVF